MLLVIDRKETTVRHVTGALRIERPDEPAKTVPIQMLGQVVVYGNPLVESAVWRALADAGVPAILVDLRGKQQTAFLGAGLATQLPVRRMQHRCADDAGKQLVMARYVVQQKLLGYSLPAQCLQSLFAADPDGVQRFQQQVTQTLAKLPDAASINSLTGLEGQVAAAWFALLGTVLAEPWGFNGRNRQPPRDPVNALLSLGYTLMLGEVRHAVLLAGFDPALGFLHQDYPGRESLPLDVLEIFRASVDAFVLGWLHNTRLDKGSFYYREAEGCRLSKGVRPLFYAAWAQFRQHCPRPFCPDGGGDWPHAGLGEIINGQVMRVRDVLKQTDLG
ncbi:MAG: CRISPR-associated endonuclease Cas1 [Thiothrix sp.]|uniref:CRISPR-associated endonuclease Cas1 n=1 Tax=Thiothrix sp. TaxID=1032 RepID=UPI00262BFC39|nr:CRISPR-associated endonuclease Cas1 [Thiothrix sp.]MDD5392725.1 CRISPR-associated endonuclease Cas1 [Thiothrix sp.]